MDNQLALFSNSSLQIPETAVQTAFNWDEVFDETKELAKEDAELTATIDDAMVKRFHGRVKIGFNLMALQKDHSKNGYGNFTTQVLPELGIDPRFSQRCISVARLYQNSIATHGSRSSLFDLPMSIRTWENLASPSGQTVVKQLESGEIQPTQEVITKALEGERARLAEERQRAKQLEQELEAERKAHSLFREDVELREQTQKQVDTARKRENERLKQERDQLEQQVKDLRDRTIPLLTQQVNDLKEEIASTPISPETKEQIEKLQSDLVEREFELKKRTEQRDNLAQLRERLSKELDEQRDANKARHEQEMHEFRVNDRIKKIGEEWGKYSVSLLGQLPSPIEGEVVNAANWALIDHIKDMAQRIVEAVNQVYTNKTNLVIDAG